MFSLEFLQHAVARGEVNLRIELLASDPLLAGVADVEEAWIEATITSSRATIQSCASPSRPFEAVTVDGRSVIRTRYVHMWHEWQMIERWPAGWVA